MIRQLVPAIVALHAHDHEIAHGALAPERIVITPRAQLTIVDHAVGGALEHLRFSHQRYFKDLRVALPRSAGLPHFDHRVDVMQIGVVALSLILGRLLHDDEYPAKLPELVGSAWAISDAGDLQPLPPGMRAWLSRALQIDLRNAFTSAAQASAEFDRMLSADGYAAEPASLERFLARYHEKVPAAAPAPVIAGPGPGRAARRNDYRRAAVPYAVPRVEATPKVDAPRPVADFTTPRLEVAPRPVVETAAARSAVEMPARRVWSNRRLVLTRRPALLLKRPRRASTARPASRLRRVSI